MQSSLTDKIIQSIRQTYLSADIPTLLNHWTELNNSADANGVFPLLAQHAPSDAHQLLKRDLLAIFLTRVAHWMKGHVRGDFVRALYSGKSWHIFLASFDTPQDLDIFQRRGPIIFRELVGLSAKDVHCHFPLHIRKGTISDKDISIPVHFLVQNEANHHPVPSTYGLQLQLDLYHGVHLAPFWPDRIVPLSDILHALRNGCDIHMKQSWKTTQDEQDEAEEEAEDDYHMLTASH